MLRDPYSKKTSLLKFIRDFCFYIFLYGAELLVLSQTKKLWKLEKLKPRKKYALIISGGPSYDSELQEFLLQKQGIFDLFALNFYCLSTNAKDILPKYYFVSDPYIIGDNKYESGVDKVMNLNDYIKRHSPKVVYPDSKAWSKFAPINSLPMCDREALFTKSINPWRPRSYTSNTAFKAIAIALYLGYEKIFIVGMDYDYPRKIYLDQNSRLALMNEHHYESSQRYMDHVFSSVSHALRWWADDFHHLSKLKSPKVYNVSSNSLIDVFKRISTAEFFRMLDQE